MVKENMMVQTEIGLVSEDWVLETFGDCLEGFSSGMTPYRGNKEYYKGDFPWITSGELNYNIITDTIEKITPLAIKNTNLKVIPKGTFLMAITGLEAEGTRGSCAITGIKATTNQSCMALYPQKNKITTSFLYHYYVAFGNELALKYCQGTKQQSYNAVTAKKLPICYPKSLPEQEAIAEALSDADAWIESLEQLIAKKRLIKQGAMQELLTPKEDWEVKKLGDLVVINSGYSPSMFNFIKDGISYLKVDELNNSAKYTVKGSYFIEAGSTIKKGSIIFPKRGASIFLNKIRILGEDSFMDTNLMTLTVSENYDNEFLYYSLIYFGLDKIADTTSIPQINNKHILPLEIYFPSLTNQTHIATILSDMDVELEALEAQLAKAKQVKQGMMQELLTGRVRLV